MATVAHEMIDNLLNIPAEQRKTELMRINALMDVAGQLAKQPRSPLVRAKTAPIARLTPR